MNQAIQEVKSIERTPENIAMVAKQLEKDVKFKRKGSIYQEIMEGRLSGYTPDNCPHPLEKSHVIAEVEWICKQCGYQGITG